MLRTEPGTVLYRSLKADHQIFGRTVCGSTIMANAIDILLELTKWEEPKGKPSKGKLIYHTT
jgi:hypothetical protein